MPIKESTVNDIDELMSILTDREKKSLASRNGNHYADNEKLLPHVIWYVDAFKEYKESEDQTRPQLPDPVALAIINTCNRFINHRYFVRYTDTWKGEMIGDAIETCLRYIHNFDYTKYKNVHTYITQMAYSAYKHRIRKEKRQLYYKYKLYQNKHGFSADLDENINEGDIELLNDDSSNMIMQDVDRYVAEYEERADEMRKKKQQSNRSSSPLDEFFVDVEEGEFHEDF